MKEKNIAVIDRNGRNIKPETIAWSKYTARNFPYKIRQEPGPGNALGLIKIIFPNEHLVYIRDTLSKRLFERTDHTFSLGCIRTEKPFELAQILLDDHGKWNP